MIFDFWYNDSLKDVFHVMVYFSDIDCKYHGIMSDKAGKTIGDFTALDSVEVERHFPGIFND